MDMLITGMHGQGNVGLQGCSDTEYLQHFAMWAFMSSPLIIGADIRNIDEANKNILLNKNLIAINQDDECRPAFCITNNDRNCYAFAKIISGNRIALGLFNVNDYDEKSYCDIYVSFDDLGIHSCANKAIRFKDAVTDEEVGTFKDGRIFKVGHGGCKILIGEIIDG